MILCIKLKIQFLAITYINPLLNTNSVHGSDFRISDVLGLMIYVYIIRPRKFAIKSDKLTSIPKWNDLILFSGAKVAWQDRKQLEWEDQLIVC